MSYLIDLYALCLRRDARVQRFLDWIDAPVGRIVEFGCEDEVFEDVVARTTRETSLQGSIYRDDSAKWGLWSVHFIEDSSVIFSISLPSSKVDEIKFILSEFVDETGADIGYAAAETPPPGSVHEFQELVKYAPVLDWVVGAP